MITRGHQIGKIVDDIAQLQYQIQARNKLGLLDLTKVCEDFCKEIINIAYGYNLKNLNEERNNEPGIDLGDISQKKAFQITSTKTSQKINHTLEKITETQLEEYNEFFIFILGKKQKSYTLDDDLKNKYKFSEEEHILDLDDFLKKIITIDSTLLELLFNLFQREFRQIKIELEPIDTEGNYETSYYRNLEEIPNTPPDNAKKLFEFESYSDEFSLVDLKNLYHKLSKVPRITRELIPIIIERGDWYDENHIGCYKILPRKLEHLLKIKYEDLKYDLHILEEYDLIDIDIGFVNNNDKETYFIELNGNILNLLASWLVKNNYSLKDFFILMQWNILDK